MVKGAEKRGYLTLDRVVDLDGAVPENTPEFLWSPCVSLKDMPPEKQAEMVRLYGAGPPKRTQPRVDDQETMKPSLWYWPKPKKKAKKKLTGRGISSDW
jgi:hypothetical protein